MNLCSIKKDFFHYFFTVIIILLFIEYGPEITIRRKYLLLIIGMFVVYILKQTFTTEHFNSKETNNIDSDNDDKGKLSDVEIISHVQNIIKIINQDIKGENKINELIGVINNDSDPKKYNLLKIINITMSNPVLISRLSIISPQKVLEFADLLSKSPDSIPEENNIVKSLTKKINELETIINKQPKFLQKLIDQGKYEDKDGQIRDIPYGDMLYSQTNPSQMQPPVRKNDDEWDTTGYMLVDSHRWFGDNPNPNNDLYEETKCPVCPNMTKGYPTNLMEFDSARYVISSDNINIDYIKKLNSKKL